MLFFSPRLSEGEAPSASPCFTFIQVFTAAKMLPAFLYGSGADTVEGGKHICRPCFITALMQNKKYNSKKIINMLNIAF